MEKQASKSQITTNSPQRKNEAAKLTALKNPGAKTNTATGPRHKPNYTPPNHLPDIKRHRGEIGSYDQKWASSSSGGWQGGTRLFDFAGIFRALTAAPCLPIQLKSNPRCFAKDSKRPAGQRQYELNRTLSLTEPIKSLRVEYAGPPLSRQRRSHQKIGSSIRWIDLPLNLGSQCIRRNKFPNQKPSAR